MTNKQKRFCEEYLIDLNATQAAIRAGYTSNYANTNANKLLQNTTIQKALNKSMKNREVRTEITQDKVLRELAEVAFSNGTDFAQIVTRKRAQRFWDEGTQDYKEREVDEQSVELFDTNKLPPNKKSAISGIKEGKYGIEVSSCDKVKALELLGKHLGMFTDNLKITGDLGVQIIDDIDPDGKG